MDYILAILGFYLVTFGIGYLFDLADEAEGWSPDTDGSFFN